MTFIVALALAAMVTGTPAAQTPAAPVPPHRVYDASRGGFTDLGALVDALAASTVVFIGEQHDDAEGHGLQAAILDRLRQRQARVVLSLEMIERDAQDALDAYLAGRKTEQEFLAASRPWPRYATDYRPLVEIARAAGWPVLASNVPRRIAAEASRKGVSGLPAARTPDAAFAARDVQCPYDGYFDRFDDTMRGHGNTPGAPPMDAATLDRYYLAQCLKDETMAESIARAVAADPGALVVHVAGAFHSDFDDGVVARVRRRLPSVRLTTMSIVPVASLEDVRPDDEDRARAAFLLFTRKP